MCRITKITNLPDIYVRDNILSIEHRAAGLTLIEDEDTVTLYQRGKEVARWIARNVTIVAIHKEADRWLPKRDAIGELVAVGGISIGRR